MSRTPDPQTWRSDKLTQNFIADYKPFVMVDGEGVRCSLYVSGCPFACEGCFNQAAWSFKYGKPFTQDLKNQILEDLSHSAVQGLSLLGGEPFLNTNVCLEIVKTLRQEHANTKDVWIWSGYTFEELTQTGHPDKLELLSLVDVLVDGRFQINQRDTTLAFRGSRNQRVLNVPKSLKQNKAVLH